uniref:Protein tyrosine phosphatase receptor type C-associated protein n=1 Tax=Geotrypetes seraphini TaxID=260995 RepID=A0A6P8PPC9_GEOSA|nr:protein tyrosine phosphatase receptor type C-associated protein [Geotrypetes seraphini]
MPSSPVPQCQQIKGFFLAAMAQAGSGWTWVSLSLFFMFGVQALEKEPKDFTTTVVVLLLLFLFLLAAFIVAWYHLNRITEGRYHPRNLCRGDDEEEWHAGAIGRLLRAVAGTWRIFYSRVRGEAADEHLREDAEEMELPQRDEEEGDDGEDTYSQRSMGRRSSRAMDDGADESSSNEPNSEDDYSSCSGRDLRDGVGAQTPKAAGEKPKAGSSEALLCDLHAFSGSAVWQEDSLQGSERQDVTAL